MEISVLGFITIVISIYAFFKNEKLLLYMMVFLSTFTAVNLIHITVTTTPIQAFEFTGAIWLLREFINFVKKKPKLNKDIIINKFKENKLALAFLIFIMTIIMGELYLAVSGVSIDYIDIKGEAQVLKFSRSNITLGFITIFIFVNMIVLSFKIKTKEEAKELLKVFCISSIFAAIWGLLQFVTFYFGIPYPTFLFNNNIYAYQGYDQIANNIKRISSIALEPSTFAVNLTCFIPFILGAFLKMKNNLRDKKYIIVFVLVVITTLCAILTTSSTTYVGLVVVYALFTIYVLFGFKKKGELSDRKQNLFKIIIVVITSIIIAIGLCFVCVKIGYKLGVIEHIENISIENEDDKKDGERQNYLALENMLITLKQMTIDKLSTGSGQERMDGEKIGLSMFKYSPIFGLGFCSYRTFSLFTNILLNTGILGVLAYFYILYIVIKELIEYRKREETLSIAFLISIIGTTICLFAGVPDLLYTFYWIIIVIGYKYATLKE